MYSICAESACPVWREKGEKGGERGVRDNVEGREAGRRARGEWGWGRSDLSDGCTPIAELYISPLGDIFFFASLLKLTVTLHRPSLTTLECFNRKMTTAQIQAHTSTHPCKPRVYAMCGPIAAVGAATNEEEYASQEKQATRHVRSRPARTCAQTQI